jgi:hypothetical protein
LPQQPRRYPRQDRNVLPLPTSNANPFWEDAVRVFLRQRTGDNVAGATVVTYRDYLLGPRLRTFRLDHGIS